MIIPRLFLLRKAQPGELSSSSKSKLPSSEGQAPGAGETGNVGDKVAEAGTPGRGCGPAAPLAEQKAPVSHVSKPCGTSRQGDRGVGALGHRDPKGAFLEKVPPALKALRLFLRGMDSPASSQTT